MSINLDPAVADRMRAIQQVHSTMAAIKLLLVLIFIILLSVGKIGYVTVLYPYTVQQRRYRLSA